MKWKAVEMLKNSRKHGVGSANIRRWHENCAEIDTMMQNSAQRHAHRVGGKAQIENLKNLLFF